MTTKKLEAAPSKRVGIWIRVSTEDQAQGESPKHHEQRARNYADLKHWNVIEVYHLEAVSGKSVMGHPETKRMMKDIDRGHITGLIFSKLARLGRDTKELLEFSDFFQKHEADLVSLQESIDTSSPAGRLFYTMIAAMAHWEREEIASRVAASIPIRAKLGKPLGGKAPFGYRWSPEKKLEVDPKTAPVRKLIYEYFAEHKRKRRVATILNEAGYRTQTGHPFTVTTIQRLLRDPVAKGTRRTNYVRHDETAKNGWKLKPESDWVYIDVEPIVPAELWDRCNQILDEQQAKAKPPARKAVQLFGGLTWCECGQKMYVKSNTPKYVCGACHHKIAIEDLEAIFHEQLRGYFTSPKKISEYLHAANAGLKEKQELVQVLRQEQAKVKQEMERLYQLYLADQIPVLGFGDRNRPLDARYNELAEEIPRLEAEVDYLKINLLSQDEILTQGHDLYDHWPNLSRERKRQVVENLVERITIGREEISIELYYLPTAPDSIAGPNTESDPSPPRRSRGTPLLTRRNSGSHLWWEELVKGSRHAAAW